MADVIDFGTKLDPQIVDRVCEILSAALGQDEVVGARDVLGAELRSIVEACNTGDFDPMAPAVDEARLAQLLSGKGQPHRKAVLYAALLLLRVQNVAT